MVYFYLFLIFALKLYSKRFNLGSSAKFWFQLFTIDPTQTSQSLKCKLQLCWSENAIDPMSGSPCDTPPVQEEVFKNSQLEVLI